VEELKYITASMFHLNKVKQLLTRFQSHQVLAGFLTDEGLLDREEKGKKKKKRN
jgi:hypothetical protein